MDEEKLMKERRIASLHTGERRQENYEK
jgi:hypothetical protein